MKIKVIIAATLVLTLFACDEVTRQETKAAQQQVDVVSSEVAKDEEAKYDIAVKNGSSMDAYMQATIVAAAYLQAKDSVNYKKWKDIEKKHAKEVGL